MSEDRGITPAPKKKNTKAPYNPFAGQYYVDKFGKKIKRNPSNASERSGG